MVLGTASAVFAVAVPHSHITCHEAEFFARDPKDVGSEYLPNPRTGVDRRPRARETIQLSALAKAAGWTTPVSVEILC